MSLPNFEAGRKQHLTDQLVMLCSSHSVLQNIDRIGIVRRLGGSNGLKVLSSANRVANTNTMTSDYSCFVNAQGSLFEIKPSAMRYYKDANTVVQQYLARGLPPQRSIARIAQMGLGVGICSGVFAQNRLVGFVFLNGKLLPSDLDQENIAMLCEFIFSTARSVLIEKSLTVTYWMIYDEWRQDYIAKRLDAKFLTDAILRVYQAMTGKSCEIFVNGLDQLQPLLVSHGNIAQIIARVLTTRQRLGSIQITVTVDGEDLVLRVDSSGSIPGDGDLGIRIVASKITEDAEMLGMRWNTESSEVFTLRLATDYASPLSHVDYSVEQF
jgi:hypothetical protein